jgi:glycosyltransferase involved in cell wall biosynthesis
MTGDTPTRDDKLHILFYLLYYLPHRTGVPIYVERLSQELVQRGHTVTILTAQHQPDLPRHETIDGVHIRRIYAPPIPISRGMIMPNFPLVAWKYIQQADVVSVQTPVLETALMSLLSSWAGKKIVVTHHGDLILPKGLSNRFIQNTMFALYKFMARRAPTVVLYSEDYANHSYYAAPVRDKVQTIYPPILMPEANPERAAEMRAEWSKGSGPIIGYAGRFVEEKRPDLLIKALDTINTQYPNARIVFAGQYDIPYENTWEHYQPIVEKYKDQLIFLGLIDDMQFMADYFMACDVLALPSDSECFALVQVEAMLAGTPVMMTDTPGGRVPVQVTGMGKLAKAGDPVAMGEAVIDILNNPDQYIRPREEIEQCFSFQETVNRYEQLFYENAVRS